MKKFVVGLLTLASVSAFAKKDSIVFPQVYNYGFNIQVTVWNSTDRWVSCSGYINYSTQGNVSRNEYYFESVAPRFTSYRTIYPMNSSDRISFVSHSIFCN